MPFRTTTLLLILLLCWGPMVAQTGSCPNLNFESGNFSGWSGTRGTCCPIVCPTPGITNGRHTIMSGNGTDPNTNGVVTVVAPGGGTYSARLGNSNTNSQAEQLSYTMTVDASNSLFVYRYAVVFEDPSHSSEEQPRFEIRMFDSDGDPIDCGIYNVYATSNLPGFQTYQPSTGDPIRFKTWTTVGMDLSSYVGQTVTIEFGTGDCSQGGHFGYAYIECYCSPLTITSDFCPGSPTTTLTAPVGFASYAWNTGATTPSITIDDPQTGGQYSVVLTSVTGCTVTLTTNLTPSVVASGYVQVGDCMNNVQFSDQSQVTSGPPISSWLWNFGDGTTSTLQNTVHSFTTPGEHTISLIVNSAANCPDTVVEVLTLWPAPVVDIVTGPACLGSATSFEDATELVLPLAERRWDPGDGSPVITDQVFEHIYPAAGTYDVWLYLEYTNGCADSLEVPVTVVNYPVVELGDGDTLCAGESVVIDATSPGNAILWSTGQTSSSITRTTTGTVQVTVTGPSGCATVDSVHHHFNPLPVSPQLSDTTLCVELQVVLDAGNPGCTYAWSTGGTGQTNVVSLNSGVVSVEITTPEGCSITDDAQVTFIPSVSVDLGPDIQVCDGSTVLLDAGAGPGLDHLWNNGATTSSILLTASSENIVEVTNGYCTDRDTVIARFDMLPVFDLVDTTTCINKVVQLDAGNPGCTYLWNTGATTRDILVGLVSGTYSVVVTTPENCVDSAAVQVTFAPLIELDLGADSVLCEGDTVLLDATNPDGIYTWSTGETTATILGLRTDTFFVEVTNGHCTGSDRIALDFRPYPDHVQRSVVDTCFEEPYVVVELIGMEADHILWSTSDTTRSISVIETGMYVVQGTDAPRCTTTDTIRVRELCPPRVFVPNAFTPNGDRVNDLFGPVLLFATVKEFIIFDRWGSPLFTSVEDDHHWDGTAAGNDVPVGVYNWRLVYADEVDVEGTTGRQHTRHGHVTLIR